MKQLIKTLIVEDDEIQLHYTARLLKQYKHLEFDIDLAQTIEDAQKLLAKNSYKLSFLDYQMDEEGTLFITELTKKVNRGRLGYVVYTSIHTNPEAGEIIQIGANDHLYKSFYQDDMDALLERTRPYLIGQTERVDFIHLNAENGIVKILNEDVYYISVKGNYALFYCTDVVEPYKARTSLDSLEGILDSNTFVRSHNSYIINYKRIVRRGQGVKEDYLYFSLDKDYPYALFTDNYKEILTDLGVIAKPIGSSSRD